MKRTQDQAANASGGGLSARPAGVHRECATQRKKGTRNRGTTEGAGIQPPPQLDTALPNLLALGMSWNGDFYDRDTIRLRALTARGYNVYTVGNWHPEALQYRHLNANFNVSRRFFASLDSAFPGVAFSTVVLDYFWLQAGWLAQLGRSLNALATEFLARDVQVVWFPNDSQGELVHELQIDHELVTFQQASTEHPLYMATNDCEAELVQHAGDASTNAAQCTQHLDHAHPFIRIQ